MRVPALSAALCVGLFSFGLRPSESAAALPPPLLVLERADDGARADGLAARRIAVYADGTLLCAERDGSFPGARLDAAALQELLRRLDAARLGELPAVVATRAAWFDTGGARCTLVWNGREPATVVLEGDLRPGSPDRALAPHGFVEVLEALEGVRPEAAGVDAAADAGNERAEFVLEPWSPRARSPQAADPGTDPSADPLAAPLDWPAEAEPPQGRRALVEGPAARDLWAAARAGRAVRWEGALWRVLVRPLFPREVVERTAGTGSAPPRRG
jgi:hypothetical protein